MRHPSTVPVAKAHGGRDAKCQAWGPDSHPSHACREDRAWKVLGVEISGLGSVTKLLEAFGHKRGQLPGLAS